ncbi:hypothetical protein B7P43_G03461 [Cryptotermes secundus]|uniref:BHLH domain-containing protein n=2 Tax=Cryptotermes secundus TaxID=105785 RepID=A0A2J7RLP0_9NEOP|nr:hypothetical protein B7P43_G03461 [Cryptotermes secundus]
MATLGVVPFSNSMTSSHTNKLQIIQHPTASVSNSGSSEHPERREILILRKKAKPIITASVSESSEPVLATSGSNAVVNNGGRIRKKPTGVGSNLPRSHHQPPPVAVARRNARERNRVKQVNNGFATLRQHIPLSVSSTYSSGNASSGGRSNKKLSKVETLRMAVDYIRSLQQLLSMDDNGTNANIQAVHSTDSSDTSSPTSLVVHSPPSPANSSTNLSTADLQHGYQTYEDEGVQTDVPDSPVLIDDEDDASLIDPTSPLSSSALTASRYTPQYHRIRGTNTFIQLVNTQPDAISSTEDGEHYEMDEPFAALASSFPNVSRDGGYIVSQGQLHRLQAHHLVTTSVDTYQQPSSVDLVTLGSTRAHPTSSLSPGDYSEHSLSPETPHVDDIAMFRTTSSASFLPSFSSSLKSSSPTTALQHVTSSSPMQSSATTTAGSMNATSVIHHQSYPVNAELLPSVKIEERPGEEECASGTVITNSGQEVMDMMTWWEQEQKLRLITSIATSSS